MSKSRKLSTSASNKGKSSKSVEPSNSKSSKESKSKKISSNSKLLPDDQGYESESLLDVETLRETRRSILAVERLKLEKQGQINVSDKQIAEGSPILNLLNCAVEDTIRTVEKSTINGKVVEPLKLVSQSKMLKELLLQTTASMKKELEKLASYKHPDDDDDDMPPQGIFQCHMTQDGTTMHICM
jgi:hypothetical protein